MTTSQWSRRSGRATGALILALVAGCTTQAGSSGGPSSAFDTSACPVDATTALKDGEPINLGTTAALSGPSASPEVAEGMRLYFEQINEKGGVAGHKIELTVKDDAFDPTKAVNNVTELAQQEGVLAIVAQQGSANITASQKVLEPLCVPQMWNPAGLPELGDPVHHPWTTMANMSYDTEATAWAEYIKQRYPSGAKVGVLGFNSAFTPAYVEALKKGLKGSKSEVVIEKLHEATAVTLDNEITAIVAATPDIIVGSTAGTFCGKAQAGVKQSGFKGELILSALCGGISQFFAPSGPAADGTLIFSWFADPADALSADLPEIKEYKELVASNRPDLKDPNNRFMQAGYFIGAVVVENLERAAKSTEGLSRVSLMKAMWSTDMPMPFSPDGHDYRFKVSGTDDAYPVESAVLYQYNAEKSEMKPTDIAIDLEGKTGVYEDN